MLTSKLCYQIIGPPHEENDMIVWNVPIEFHLGAIPKRIYCNRRLIIPLTNAFTAIKKANLGKEIFSWDGCFNIRKKKGGTSDSLHSWGLAIDINASENRFNSPPNMNPLLVKAFTSNGFDWGGKWSKPDGMHFQLTESAFSRPY